VGKNGAKIWYFVDGYLPEKVGPGPMEAHEALMLLNANSVPAAIRIDVYFEDKNPITDIKMTVGAERVRALRLDHPEDIGGVAIPPLTQYSVRVRSDVEIVAQFGRLDTTQVNMAYYGCAGYCSGTESDEESK
jgi:hypothetical protein